MKKELFYVSLVYSKNLPDRINHDLRLMGVMAISADEALGLAINKVEEEEELADHSLYMKAVLSHNEQEAQECDASKV